MLKDARRGKFAVLVIWALERFGRSMIGNLSDVLELDRIGVTVVSARETWLDTGGPVRSLLIAIFSWVAEQERARPTLILSLALDLPRRSKLDRHGDIESAVDPERLQQVNELRVNACACVHGLERQKGARSD